MKYFYFIPLLFISLFATASYFVPNQSITTDKIANLAVTAAQIANSTITSGKIAASTILGSNIANSQNIPGTPVINNAYPILGTASSGNYRIVSGAVNTSGVGTGEGFTVGGPHSTGIYKINFNTAFSSTPYCTGICTNLSIGCVVQIDATNDLPASVTFNALQTASSAVSNQPINFICIGTN